METKMLFSEKLSVEWWPAEFGESRGKTVVISGC